MKPDALKREVGRSLSAKLLLLTVAFVMLGEVLIYAPSIARFRKAYLEDHIARARLASIAIEQLPSESVSPEIRARLLAQSESRNIVLRLPERSVLVHGPRPVPPVEESFDLREPVFFGWIVDAFRVLLQPRERVIRVIGPAQGEPDIVVEVTLDEMPLRAAMIDYSVRILALSIVISAIAAGLVYLSLQLMMVRPMRRITDSMAAFRSDPMNERVDVTPSARADEIGQAERELQVMQRDVRLALRQRRRLAALGAAVAKINHDLRNTLTKAMLASDRLSASDDPTVQRVLPRLIDAIERATKLCSETLNFAGRDAPELNPSRFALHDLVADVESHLTGADAPVNGARLVNRVARDVEIEADREQLFRAMINVSRNAFEAGARTVEVSLRAAEERVCVDIADDGPGLSDKARDNLFTPFLGSARSGGTGLGLVIVRDVMRAHGGDIRVVKTDAGGTTFCLELPEKVAAGARFWI